MLEQGPERIQVTAGRGVTGWDEGTLSIAAQEESNTVIQIKITLSVTVTFLWK